MHASLIAIVAALTFAGCATAFSQAAPPPGLAQRTGVPERPDDVTGVAIPQGISLTDGLSQDEAVAIALWNNPTFRVQLADLGFARADLLEAGLLRNPILSVLFPIGPKQLEATLKWPIEVLWERPRRVAAAGVAVERVAAALEQSGLNLIADVKIAFVDLALARDRAQLAEMAASELDQIRMLTDSRLRAGDISELEARSASVDAARARQDAIRAGYEITLRANSLRALLGLALEGADIIIPAGTPTLGACGPSSAALLDEALASRPDVRAAELAVEEAGRRLRWERSRILALTAALDANAEGRTGFETGPGVDVGLPFFDRNQAGRARGTAELQRATRGYLAARQRVATEVRDATGQFDQATATLAAWRDTVLTPLEAQVRAAELAFRDGDVSYLFVLDITRRLTDARLRARDAEADLARAVARTERAIGRRCDASRQEIARGF